MSNPVVLEYSRLCGHHHEQTEDMAIPRRRNPGTVSIAPLAPAALSSPPASVDPPVLDASYPWNHNTWLKGPTCFPEPDNTFEVPPHCLVSWTHVRLLSGVQSWWWSTGFLVIRVGSVGPPEGGVAPGADWVGLLLQSWAVGHCCLVAIQVLACSGLIPASQPTH